MNSMGSRERLALAIIEGADRPLYAQDVVNAAGGQLSRGTIYVFLGSLEDRGYVISWPEPDQIDGLLPRRLYDMTGEGILALAASDGPRGLLDRMRGAWRAITRLGAP